MKKLMMKIQTLTEGLTALLLFIHSIWTSFPKVNSFAMTEAISGDSPPPHDVTPVCKKEPIKISMISSLRWMLIPGVSQPNLEVNIEQIWWGQFFWKPTFYIRCMNTPQVKILRQKEQQFIFPPSVYKICL